MFKAHWNTEGDNVRLSMPFSKVDEERRTVSGFATLDNIDKQADIVTAEASVQAFSKFRGNIREMHQPTAVGKMVNFKEEKYFDPETKKFYSGVYVSAYISKGAQDTWEKVLDGTLSGFSIGGKMNKWDDAYDEKMDAKIRIIKEYDLVELSLVDSPANQFANILSVEKVDGVDVVTGADANLVIENVFYDADSGLVVLSEEESAVSPTSGLPMENIGFVEKTDEEKADMIKFLVDSAKGINLSKMTKEVSPMTEATETAEEVVVEEVEVAPEADAEAVEETAEVAAAEAEEAPAEEAPAVETEEEVSKSDEVDTVRVVSEIKDNLTSAFSDLAATVKALNEQVAALNKSIDSVKSEVAETKEEFGKRVDAVEADTAFRKSGDLGEIVQEQPDMVEKTLWGGRFLKTADLLK
jgi:outer membrane murein-binding lipoprotein Lpp